MTKGPADLVVKNGYVVTMNPRREILARGAVAIRDGRIAAVGREGEVVSAYAAAREIDAQGGIVHPGFIDTHVHFMNTARGAFRDTLEIESHIFLSGALEATSEFGYSLLVSTATHDPSGIVATLETGRADGVILMEVRLADERVEKLRADGHPFSLIGRCEDNDGISYVDFDFEDAVRTAVHHLYELGHRHVALLNRAPSIAGADYGPTVRSQIGFESAVNELSIAGDQLLCGTSGAQYIEVLRFLERETTCTAAVTLSVTYAPLLAALRDLGRRVPEDFSVVAIIASQVADLVTPPLTTIDMPAYEMGRLGAEILIHQLTDDELPPSQILLRGSLRVRSSGPPPRRSRA